MRRKKDFHLFPAFCLLLLLAVVVSGCGQEKDIDKVSPNPVHLDIAAFSMQLRDNLSLGEELSQVENDVFSYVYDVPGESYEEAVLLLASGATADEICIVKAADKDSKNAIKAKMEARIAAQKESFASYLPEEAAKLDNAIITEIDSYLVLVVCGNPEQAKTTIQQVTRDFDK